MSHEGLDADELLTLAKTLEERGKLIPVGLILHRQIWLLAARSLKVVSEWKRDIDRTNKALARRREREES